MDRHYSRVKSIFLLGAILLMLLFGLKVFPSVLSSPLSLINYFCLYLLFFFLSMVVALSELISIQRDYLKKRRDIFRSTIGEPDFLKSLRKDVESGF